MLRLTTVSRRKGSSRVRMSMDEQAVGMPQMVSHGRAVFLGTVLEIEEGVS
jgi:hypothetical protein